MTASRIFGEDLAQTTYAAPVRFDRPGRQLRGMARAVAPPGRAPHRRAARLALGMPRLARALPEVAATDCDVAQPLVMVGSALYAMLPAMELAPLAAVEPGGDPAAAQEALLAWFAPTLLASAVTFGAGAAASPWPSWGGVLSWGPAGLVAASLLIMAGTRFVPLSAVQFYVQGGGLLRGDGAPGEFHVAARRCRTRLGPWRHRLTAAAAGLGPDVSRRCSRSRGTGR